LSSDKHQRTVSSTIESLSINSVQRQEELGYINYNPDKIPYILTEIVKEANLTYILTQYTASIATSAIALERTFFEVVSKKIGKKKAKKSNLFGLIELAFAYKIITQSLRDDAHKIREIRNNYIHANFDKILRDINTDDEFDYGSFYIISSKDDALTAWEKIKNILEHIYHYNAEAFV